MGVVVEHHRVRVDVRLERAVMCRCTAGANPKQTIECGENRVSDFSHGFGCIAVRERRLAADNHQRLPTFADLFTS